MKRSLGTLRIIGGQWRRRHITFPNIPNLRPTHDRVRETLFNWLVPFIEGASCLDLFAGSGALGFEALSRGAKQVTFVDNNPEIIDAIRDNAENLGAQTTEIVLGSCPKEIPQLTLAPYDIVFLDPPFHQNLLNPAITWLRENHCLKAKAFIYIETEKSKTNEWSIPADWNLIKADKTTRLVYYLFSFGGM